MHVPTLLRTWLGQSLKFIHATRLAALFDLVGATALKQEIKRADRLIGNPHLYRERSAIYGALCRVTLARIAEPLILVDWTDLKADQSYHLLRTAITVGGYPMTLYEEIHHRSLFGNRRVQDRFLRTLARLVPPGIAPIIIADSGFRVPFFRAVEALGWRWVGRLRGRDFVRLGADWESGRLLFSKAKIKPVSWGYLRT